MPPRTAPLLPARTSALGQSRALLVTVVAEPHITWMQWGSRVVPGMMAGLATSVANSFIRATVACVPRLSTCARSCRI